MEKLQESCCKLADKLIIMKYAILGFIEENGDAYFFEGFQKEILKDFYDIQDEIDRMSLQEFIKNS